MQSWFSNYTKLAIAVGVHVHAAPYSNTKLHSFQICQSLLTIVLITSMYTSSYSSHYQFTQISCMITSGKCDVQNVATTLFMCVILCYDQKLIEFSFKQNPMH